MWERWKKIKNGPVHFVAESDKFRGDARSIRVSAVGSVRVPNDIVSMLLKTTHYICEKKKDDERATYSNAQYHRPIIKHC